jgi:thioredoxin 1
LHAQWQGKAAVQFIDVWKYSDGVEDFPIQVIPTQVFFNADGTPFVPSESLQKQIAFTLYSSKDTGEHVFTVHQGGIAEDQMRQIFAEMGVK